MTSIAAQFGMKEALAQLGIKPVNEGTSTGINSFSSGIQAFFVFGPTGFQGKKIAQKTNSAILVPQKHLKTRNNHKSGPCFFN